ncbi:VCBS repeat-containing protein [Streptomyces sp. NPDC051742]|uniref:VCBS repeat-containing protein n=1 Tax=unclassified Streptomyces TaxID=2593676 RepID=UPI00343564FD
MRFTNSKRAGRIAACTALALSAGMLLAGPASADEPTPTAQKVERSFTPPQLAHPKQDSARAGAAAAETASSLPLSDLDGDFYDDLIYRAIDGEIYTTAQLGEGETFDLYRFEDVAKEIIPIGDQGGETTHPELLILSENGTLKLYTDVSATGTPYESTVGGGWQVYNKIVSPGDVNDDGLADVVARTKDGQLYLYLATGDLSRPLGTRILVGGGWNIYDQLIGSGDVTGDGRADLYARDTAGNLYFYSGTGDTSAPFAGRRLIGGGWGAYNQITNFGEATLLARTNAGTFYRYFAENANGSLSARQQLGEAGDGVGIVQFAGGGGNPYTGKDTLIGRTSAGTLKGYFADTTGGLIPAGDVSDPGEYAGTSFTNTSSFNSDSYSDIAEVWSDGSLWIDYARIGGGWGIYNTLVGPGDLSGDGKGDLLARDRSGILYLYKGNGNGTAVAARQQVGTGWGVYNKILGAGDYTGDGRTDLVARTTAGDLYLYAGTGSATTPFKPRVKIGTGWQTYKQLAAPGDLNADGKADLLGVTSGGDLYRYLNTTPGKFTARTKIGYGYQAYNSMS